VAQASDVVEMPEAPPIPPVRPVPAEMKAAATVAIPAAEPLASPALAAAIEKQEKQEAALAELRQALESQREDLAKRIEALASPKEELVSQKDELASQKGELASLKDELASLKDGLASQREDLRAARAALGESVEALASSLNERLAALGSDLFSAREESERPALRPPTRSASSPRGSKRSKPLRKSWPRASAARTGNDPRRSSAWRRPNASSPARAPSPRRLTGTSTSGSPPPSGGREAWRSRSGKRSTSSSGAALARHPADRPEEGRFNDASFSIHCSSSFRWSSAMSANSAPALYWRTREPFTSVRSPPRSIA